MYLKNSLTVLLQHEKNISLRMLQPKHVMLSFETPQHDRRDPGIGQKTDKQLLLFMMVF